LAQIIGLSFGFEDFALWKFVVNLSSFVDNLNRVHKILLCAVKHCQPHKKNNYRKNTGIQQIAISPDLLQLKVEPGADGVYGVLEVHWIMVFHRRDGKAQSFLDGD